MIINGEWNNENWFGRVFVDGKELLPGRSQKVINHSPDGFAWGYAGSGPSQLALAILLEAGVKESEAIRYYQKFKNDFIEKLGRGAFAIEINLFDWLKNTKVFY